MSSIMQILRRIGGTKATPTAGSEGQIAIWKAGKTPTDAASLYFHDGVQWVELLDTQGRTLKHPVASSETAPTTPTAGDFWFRPSTKALSVWDGAQWSNVAYTNVANTFTKSQVIDVTDNTNPALRITQKGTGDALRVEDEANPDATPFVIDKDGNVGIGASTAYTKLYITDAKGDKPASWDAGEIVTINNTDIPGAEKRELSFGTDPLGMGYVRAARALSFVTHGFRRVIMQDSNVFIGIDHQLQPFDGIHLATSMGTGLVMRCQQGAAATKSWRMGPDLNNSFIVSNNAAIGQYMADGSTAWTAFSDERLKTDLKPITGAIEKVDSLRSVTGRYKTDDEGKSRAFLIAQDVQRVLPEAVSIADAEKGYLGVAYSDVIPLIVAAIKELNAKIDALEART